MKLVLRKPDKMHDVISTKNISLDKFNCTFENSGITLSVRASVEKGSIADTLGVQDIDELVVIDNKNATETLLAQVNIIMNTIWQKKGVMVLKRSELHNYGEIRIETSQYVPRSLVSPLSDKATVIDVPPRSSPRRRSFLNSPGTKLDSIDYILLKEKKSSQENDVLKKYPVEIEDQHTYQ